jgi:hypothetical protein
MKKNIKFDQGVIEGTEVRMVLEIFSELENSFTQRKTFDEFFFTSTSIEVSMEKLEKLSNKFHLQMNFEDLIILVAA